MLGIDKKVFVFQIFLYFGSIVNVLASERFTIEVAEEASIGLPGALVERDDKVYIGAENGLFQLVGDYIHKFQMDELTGGFITSLFVEKSSILMTVYGKGLYTYDLKNHTLFQHPIKSNLEKHLYSGAKFGTRVLVSYVSGVAMLDITKDEAIVYHDIASFTSDEQNSIVTKVVSLDDYFYAISESGLLKVSAKTGEAQFFKTEQYFGNLKSLEMIYASESELFIAGRNGVYKSTSELEILEFIPFRDTPSWRVTVLFLDQQDRLWVGAGDMYIKSGKYLRKSEFLNPYLSSANIAEITNILQTSNGRILISSGQQDIVLLPHVKESLNYLSIDNAEFPNAIYASSPFDESSAIIATDAGYHALSPVTGQLELIKKTKLDITDLVLINHSVLDVVNCNQISKSKSGTWQVEMKISHELCGKNSKVWATNAQQTVMYEFDGQKFVDVFTYEGVFVETKILPQSASLVQRFEDGTLIVMNDKNQLLVEQAGVWSRVANEIDNQFGFACFEAHGDTVYVCTSGSGLQTYTLSSTTELQFLKTTLHSQFIRDVESIDDFLLIATNKGLEVHDRVSGNVFLVGQNQGIYDKDFSYEAMNWITKDKLLVQGDKSTYLVDATLFLHEIKNQSTAPKEVKFVYVAINGEVDRSEFTSTLASEIPYDYSTLTFYVAANVINDYEQHFLEYQVNNSLWKTIANSHGVIDLSGLKYGEYQLTVRAQTPDGRNQLIPSTVHFVITPPFYLTDTAKKAYIVLFLVAICAIILFVRHKKRYEEMQSGERVRSTLLSLESSSDLMERVFTNKEIQVLRISHEVRTPLMLITEPLKTIAKRITDPIVLDEIDLMERNAHRVSYLVDQLIEIEKLSHLQQIPYQQYDIYESCLYLIESIRPIAEQKNQIFKLSLKAKGKINLMQDTLQQIFYNLLSNAIKYSPEATTIKIVTRLDHKALVLQFVDEGPGFSDEEKVKIFERFTSLENAQTHHGIGLGLALLRDLIKANKGYIEVESLKNTGACFTIRLPMVIKEEPLTENAQVEPAAVSKSKIEQFNEQAAQSAQPIMLIAEDNEELRNRLYLAFKSQFLCFVAKDGPETLKACQMIRPAVLITDHIMPGITGLQIIEALRANEETTAISIYVISAVRDPKLEMQAYDLGINDFILKPFNLDVLKKKVANRYNAAKLLNDTTDSENDIGYFLGRVPQLEGEKDQRFYLNLRRCLDENLDDPAFSRERCAAALFVSERQLNRKLKMILDLSFSEVLKQFRIGRAKIMLEEGKSVTDTAYDCGFNNPSYFSTLFKAETGTSPSDFLK